MHINFTGYSNQSQLLYVATACRVVKLLYHCDDSYKVICCQTVCCGIGIRFMRTVKLCSETPAMIQENQMVDVCCGIGIRCIRHVKLHSETPVMKYNNQMVDVCWENSLPLQNDSRASCWNPSGHMLLGFPVTRWK